MIFTNLEARHQRPLIQYKLFYSKMKMSFKEQDTSNPALAVTFIDQTPVFKGHLIRWSCHGQFYMN